jgi:hypothetical protein
VYFLTPFPSFYESIAHLNKDNGVLKFTGGAEFFYSGLPEHQKETLYANLSTQSAGFVSFLLHVL